jgi:hypothetical protein
MESAGKAMLKPERLLPFTSELIVILLGMLLMGLGVRGPRHGRIVDRYGLPWLILSVVVLLWGLRALYKPGQWWKRWENWNRGLSLVLLGVLMLAITRVPFDWVGPMLVAGGAIVVLRGIVAFSLLFRHS